MSFANQALAAEYLVAEAKRLDKRVYGVPRHIDNRIAELKLRAMSVEIDTLTPEQETYLASWEMGT
ncbi:adenosylhomocysteinase, partial [bacterium]|nr:adenosylhomocysteinase [bacterium]